MRWIIATTFLLVSPPVAAEAQLSGTAQQASEAVEAFHAALESGDGRRASILLDDHALIFEEGHAERSKADYAAEHLPADMAFSKNVKATTIRRTGGGSGDSAWIATEARSTGSYKGKPVDRIATETVVLRRTGGAWKIVHIHWSSRAAAAH